MQPSSLPPTRYSPLFLGLDLGTSGCRGILINTKQEIVAEARVDLPASRVNGDCIEQDPADWWQGVGEVLTTLGKIVSLQHVTALCVDGTSGTVLLTDAIGIPCSPALMYNDSRARNEAEQLKAIAPPEFPIHSPNAGLPKVLWLYRNTDTNQARWLMHQADWVSAKLSGVCGSGDSNSALKTGIDPSSLQWPKWMDALAIPREHLPRVVGAGTPLGTVSRETAAQFGFSPHARVIAGTSDSTAAFIATGASKVGEAVTSLGSTLVVKVIADRPIHAMEYGIYSQPLGDLWLVGGGSNSGGAVLRNFFSDAQMQDLQSHLDPRHRTGLDYYPLLRRGERFPINDPNLEPRLSPRPTNDAQFFQGLLEGIARIEATAYQRLAEVGAPYPTRVITAGGGSRNDAWTQIRANMLQVPVTTATHSEAAYGAALLALRGHQQQHGAQQ